MFEKLKALAARLDELEIRLSAPDLYDDPDRAAKLLRERNELEPIVTAFREYEQARRTLADATEMLSDPDMKELAQEELQQAKSDIARLEDELKILLLPKDPNDEKNIYVEIRGGAGGEESALFAADLYRMYTMYADKRGWQTEVMNKSETELGGYKEVVFRVAGDKVYSRLKFESGVHRVQRVPETESQGRVHTSTTTVAVLPEAEELDFYIDPKDLRIDTFRASGAGGQHINKTSSAIRVTHIPTNTVVECQDERSQHKNKEKALSVLRSRLYEAEVEKQRAAIAADRKSQVGTGDRSGKLYGLGHAVYTMSDPRAVVIKKYAASLASAKGRLPDLELMERVEARGIEKIMTRKRQTIPMCANVDLYSGLIYSMLDIPEDLYTPLFATARIAGWCAHRLEELATGNRIMRPAYRAMLIKEPYIPVDART